MNARTIVVAGTWLAALAVLLTTPAGCNPAAQESEYILVPYSPTTSADESGGSTGDTAAGEAATDDAARETGDEAGGSPGYASSDGGAATRDGSSGGTQSGTLTAGSFDDNLNFDVFQDFVTDTLQADVDGELPNLPLGRRIIVTVKDQQGRAVGDARVVITPQTGKANETAVLDTITGSDGRVLFLTGLDDGSGSTAYTLEVHPPGGGAAIVETRALSNLEWNVTQAAASTPPSRLDLAFVIDATGSMGDELEYLREEVASIARGVAEMFPDVVQRYALIVYRDQGDLYVVRSFDFTKSLDDFQADLGAQSADGGGDWPEAVHLALEQAAKLSWTASGTARVLFLVADAPAHGHDAGRALDAVLALRQAGVALYPVAASGVEPRLEFFMRAAAVLTLSEYLFLTDDSGVGNAHAEPHIPCYHVQRLDRLMLRMIRAELSGARVEPAQENIVRTVGNPVAGVCSVESDQSQQTSQ